MNTDYYANGFKHAFSSPSGGDQFISIKMEMIGGDQLGFRLLLAEISLYLKPSL